MAPIPPYRAPNLGWAGPVPSFQKGKNLLLAICELFPGTFCVFCSLLTGLTKGTLTRASAPSSLPVTTSTPERNRLRFSWVPTHTDFPASNIASSKLTEAVGEHRDIEMFLLVTGEEICYRFACLRPVVPLDRSQVIQPPCRGDYQICCRYRVANQAQQKVV